jgi:heme-degrading monooxygenase HmoA
VIVVVFKITHRADLVASEYEELGERMVEIVSAMPGFQGMDYAATGDGELLVARFESHEALDAWREQPEHKVAQQLGRERYFEHYRIEVCEVARSYEFDAGDATPTDQ